LPLDLCLTYTLTLKMDMTCSSETIVYFQQATWRCIPENGLLLNHHFKNFKSYSDLKSRYLIGRYIVTGYELEGWDLVHGRDKFFLYSISSRTPLESTRLRIQRIPNFLSLGISGWVVNLITHLCLVPRPRTVELHFHSRICLIE
jgi:hypothetical protein